MKRSTPLLIMLMALGALGAIAPAASAAGPRAEAPPPSGERAFLRVHLARSTVYVGELVPATVRAYFPAGAQVTLRGLPELKGDAFTVTPLSDKPRQSQELVSGRPYLAVTWSTALSPIRPGEFALRTQLPATLQVRERPDLAQRLEADPFDALGDPAFDRLFDRSLLDDFFGQVREREVTLQADTGRIKVLPLPGAGRPAGFQGAVGQFTVSAAATPTQVTAGDPITLRLEVAGSGNFDRVSSAGLAASPQWRAYPPTSRFEPRDSAGAEGRKVFEQAIVPLGPAVHQIPPLTFSYFDPGAGRYVTKATAPIPVQVGPAPAGQAVAAALPPPAAAQSGPALAPNKVAVGHLVPTLRPLFQRPWFLALQAAPLLALAAGSLLVRRRERLAADPARLRARAADREVRAQLRALDRAAAEGDAGAFFLAARGALQQRLAGRWGLRPEAVTLADVDSRLDGQAEGVRQIFARAAEIAYAGQGPSAADLGRWQQVLRAELERLDRQEKTA